MKDYKHQVTVKENKDTEAKGKARSSGSIGIKEGCFFFFLSGSFLSDFFFHVTSTFFHLQLVPLPGVSGGTPMSKTDHCLPSIEKHLSLGWPRNPRLGIA